MSVKRIESIVYQGLTNSELRVSFIYLFKHDEEKYNTVKEKESGYTVMPSYLLKISEGYEKPQTFISPRKYFSFATMFDKSVKLVQDSLYDLFPNVGRPEFSMDSRAYERFIQEKAMSSAGMSIIPAIWTDSTNQCYPALQIISEEKNDSVTIALEDAIGFSRFLATFQPDLYGMLILTNLGRFE